MYLNKKNELISKIERTKTALDALSDTVNRFEPVYIKEDIQFAEVLLSYVNIRVNEMNGVLSKLKEDNQ